MLWASIVTSTKFVFVKIKPTYGSNVFPLQGKGTYEFYVAIVERQELNWSQLIKSNIEGFLCAGYLSIILKKTQSLDYFSYKLLLERTEATQKLYYNESVTQNVYLQVSQMVRVGY